jgi:hypothetical protein
MPQGYFDGAATAIADEFRERAIRNSADNLIDSFPIGALEVDLKRLAHERDRHFTRNGSAIFTRAR